VIAMMFFGAGLAGVTLLGTWGAIQWIPRWAMQLGGEAAPHAKEYSQIATGQGFALNFGRIIAAVGGLQTAALMGYFGGSFPKAGSVLVAIYLVGAVIVWLGPQTKGRPLPD
jgi:hypothetical protein